MPGTRTFLSLFLLLAVAPGLAAEQSYPTRPIKLIVPFPPGGPVDVSARILAQHLPRTLGQIVVIENRAGAAGSLGAKAVASADTDGYSLLCGNISTLVVLPAVTNNRDYDPAKVFAPVAKISQNYEVLVVHPAFSARSVPELVAYARANPGKLNYGSAGHGNATHLAAELFKLRTGVDIQSRPLQGRRRCGHRRAGRASADVLRRHRRHACTGARRPHCARSRSRANGATRFSPTCRR